MATTQRPPEGVNPSFARIVASSTANAMPPVVNTKEHPKIGDSISTNNLTEGNVKATDASSLRTDPASRTDEAHHTIPIDKVAASLHTLSLQTKTPSLVVNGSVAPLGKQLQTNISRESTSDDSQRADSSSDLGTKPPSLDGKSITSGTTFALDEKESLRPDDSASVKAAAEDDDVSIRGSFVASSRMGSEVAPRGRLMLPDRRVIPVSGPQGVGVMTPQSATSEQPPGANGEPPSDALNLIYRQAPDDKLLEALASPRDKYFLLRLEKDVIDFVQDSKEPYMDLPPSNSFCRMLTHKLADYYHMTHSFEPQIGAVRIFRTPFCRVPPSLALMSPAANPSTSSTPPPVVQPKKIMRRGQDSESGQVSAGASKATSEAGSDGKDGKGKGATPNQKLSREEREEMYKAARERIFGSSEDAASDPDIDNTMSRTSSMSANRQGPKRSKNGGQRRDISDSFDGRQQYAPYWSSQHQPWMMQQQGPVPYGPPMNQHYAGQMPAGYPAQMPPMYPPPNQAPPGPQGMPAAPYPNMQVPQYPVAGQPQYPPARQPMPAYGPTIQGTPPAAGWQHPYPTSAPTTPSRGPRGPDGIPYAYGQLPTNINPSDPKSQHPIPGSYNRNHAFNPKTQSFIPGGNQMAAPPPQPPFTAPGSHHGSPQIMPPHLAYNGYQPPPPPPFEGYGMVRQGSSQSIGSYHGSPHLPPHIPPHMQHPLPPPNLHMVQPTHQGHPQLQHHTPLRPNPVPPPPGGNQVYGNLPNYGNPATLPQKPNTGI